MERGTVSSRVALLLRSAEVKPLFNRFVQQLLNLFSFLLHRFSRVGPWDLCKLERTGQVHAKLCIHGHRALDKSLWRVLKEFVMKRLMIHVRGFCN
jgi:hypothetical protein